MKQLLTVSLHNMNKSEQGTYEIYANVSSLFVNLSPSVMVVAFAFQYFECLSHIVAGVNFPSIFRVAQSQYIFFVGSTKEIQLRRLVSTVLAQSIPIIA